ncbi:MAG: ferrous iron transport protein A [Sphaerochaeta sp.]|jgi:ferrous iron transport protein A|nr:ferrous iron transport protein A [Sphaerochaeta sp.]MCH3919233.1 ferrous iron transport protein A [Sphaerochaeta sp.]MCI2076256.1 ferrous iron transport protein A [Sphaerochaeta sp.]MCI2097619.1 ferrous iron transport protein A [Sphaerochaeta sp.]MCI2104986.1 ferrous iron transport protein A [Sphaerochaeta sp.]
MKKTVGGLTLGETGTVDTIVAPKPLKRRLMDMGFTRGVAVKMVKVAPLGDPIEVELRGYNLCLRKAEGDHISLQETK